MRIRRVGILALAWKRAKEGVEDWGGRACSRGERRPGDAGTYRAGLKLHHFHVVNHAVLLLGVKLRKDFVGIDHADLLFMPAGLLPGLTYGGKLGLPPSALQFGPGAFACPCAWTKWEVMGTSRQQTSMAGTRRGDLVHTGKDFQLQVAARERGCAHSTRPMCDASQGQLKAVGRFTSAVLW